MVESPASHTVTGAAAARAAGASAREAPVQFAAALSAAETALTPRLDKAITSAVVTSIRSFLISPSGKGQQARCAQPDPMPSGAHQ
jgi:hypothetical protein